MSVVHKKEDDDINSQHTIPYYNRYKGTEVSKNLQVFSDDIATKYLQIFNTPIRDAQDESILTLETTAYEVNNKPNSIVNNLYNLDYKSYRIMLSQIHSDCTITNIEKGIWKDDMENSKNKSDPKVISELRSLFNKLGKDINKDFNVKYIFENNRKIIADIGYYRFITNTLNKQQSVSTWLKDIKNIQRIIRLALTKNAQVDDPMSHNLYVKYSAIIYDIKTFFVDFLSENNSFNKYEIANYIPFDKILEITSRAEEKQQNMIDKIPLVAIGKRAKHIKETLKEHFKFILLAGYTWTPPSRHELFSMKIRNKIINFSKNAKEEDLYDYIYIPEDEKQLVQYVFHLDKKKHDYVKYSVGFVDNRLVVNKLGHDLSRAIRKSLKLYPRSVFLPQLGRKQTDTYNPDESMKESTAVTWLAEMGDDKRIGTSMIRSSFATYRSTSVNYNAKKNDSDKMRNSILMMMKAYVKMKPESTLKSIIMPENVINTLVKPDDFSKNLNKIDLIPKAQQTPAFRVLSNVLLRPLDFSNVQIPIQQPVVPIQQPIVPEKSALQKEKERYKKYYDSNSKKIIDQQAKYKAKNKNRIRIVKNVRVYNSDLTNGRIPNKQLQIKDELYQDPVTKLWRSGVLEKMKE